MSNLTSDLTGLTLTAALEGLSAGTFSAEELTRAHLTAMERAESLNLYVASTPDRARQTAAESDERRRRGEAGALEGIPLGIKDMFCTQGVETTACSRILKGFVPPYESTVSANLWAAGAVLLGKLNNDEFAMGSSNETSCHGAALNPWRAKGEQDSRVPGGSSGGSAGAVSAGLCLGAAGTDTGGSIRQPAAFTGTVGIKPTYGLCSRWGIVAFASSLDQAGPIAKTVQDAAILLTVMAGHDPKDSTSARMPPVDYRQIPEDVRGMRVGIPAEYRQGLSEDMAALWDRGIGWLREAGAEIVDVSLPHAEYALPAYYIIAPAEASSNLARYDGVRYGLRVAADDVEGMFEKTRAEGFGEEVQRRILMGTYVLSAGYYDAYYGKACRVRTLVARDFEAAWEKADVLLTPATPSAAFKHGEKSDDPLSMYLNDIYTVPVNMAGLPAMSVPAGLDGRGLPVGLQVIGPRFGEQAILRAGRAVEQAAGFSQAPERWWES